MKNSRKQESHQSKSPAIDNNRPRPENKDALDSRQNLEQSENGKSHHTKATHKGDHSKSTHNDHQAS